MSVITWKAAISTSRNWSRPWNRNRAVSGEISVTSGARQVTAASASPRSPAARQAWTVAPEGSKSVMARAYDRPSIDPGQLGQVARGWIGGGRGQAGADRAGT